jgi:hypothetical protein
MDRYEPRFFHPDPPDRERDREVLAVSEPANTLGWCAKCNAYLASPPEIRRAVSPQTLATYRRIRRLPRVWGEELDRRGAPLFVMRWIAWAVDPSEKERRYTTALASWEQAGRWPRWDGLTCRDDGSTRPHAEAEVPAASAPTSYRAYEQPARRSEGTANGEAPSTGRNARSGPREKPRGRKSTPGAGSAA